MTRKPILQLIRWATFAMIVLIVLYVIALVVLYTEGITEDISNAANSFEVGSVIFSRLGSAMAVYLILMFVVVIYGSGILLYYVLRHKIVKTQSNLLILLAIAIEVLLMFWVPATDRFEFNHFNPMYAILILLDFIALLLPKKDN